MSGTLVGHAIFNDLNNKISAEYLAWQLDKISGNLIEASIGVIIEFGSSIVFRYLISIFCN
jgi:hypothetical protein